MGETKRTLKVRLSEHSQAVKQGDPKNRIAVHVQKTQPVRQLGRRHSPKKGQRVLTEENCGTRPDQESHPEDEPGQWPSSTHGLELHP